MQQPPIHADAGEWERGLGWMVLASGVLHVSLVVAVWLLPKEMFIRPAPPVTSYVVDLVAPDKIGGTNLIEGSKGRVQAAPMAAKQEPPPPPPKAAEVAPPPPPVIAKVEPPPPPPPAEEKSDPEAFAERQKPTTTRPVPTATRPQQAAVAKVAPTKVPPTVPSKAALEMAAKKAAEDAKKKQVAEAAKKKAEEDAALKKAIDAAARRASEEQKRQAAQKAADERILAAAKRAEQQIGERGGGMGNKPGAAPGGPISVGPGEGAGGQTVGVDYVLYLGQLERRIKDNWAWAGANESLEAVVGFSITETGDITQVRILRASGDRGFDLSVERAVKAISPMPPPPEAYRAQFADVEYTFNAKSLQQ